LTSLGLDILSRKQFYDSLLNDYFERSRTVVVATHQVEEVQHVLTDVVFIDRGHIVFSRSMDDVESRYREVLVHPDKIATARALNPIHERYGVGRSVLLFEGVDQQQLASLGDVRTPSVADLFVAILSSRRGQVQGPKP
jgi:ABC-2 type transport system ATP-binding protein